jgi:transketolase
MSRAFGPRRAEWIEVAVPDPDLAADGLAAELARYDLVYRSLCSVLFNYAQSGHPGGSVSSGRFVAAALFGAMDYDIGDPNRRDSDLLSYAAGHKALGLYAMLALRDEVVRIGDPDALPREERLRLRLEDLLGFRRNPTQPTPLFRRFGSKALDGHPTPATPFVRLATGASGVGFGSSLGLALAAADYYGADAPRVHIIEGEGGLTPGRVAEAAAFAGTTGLRNALVHLDWNQASIDSNAVTRDGDRPGDYVQWDPREFFYLHDWNVVEVPDGFDLPLVLTAQRRALALATGQPTALVYRTTKGWQYGIEGRKSHGAGHKLCSPEFRATMEPLLGPGAPGLPDCDGGRCRGGDDAAALEECYWKTLLLLRRILEDDAATCRRLAERVAAARARLNGRRRAPRQGAPDIGRLFEAAAAPGAPAGLAPAPGGSVALREQLGRTLGYLNQASGGAILIGAADLLESTAISAAAAGFPSGFMHLAANPGSRTLSVGGICEDGLSCVLSGLSAFGEHAGAGASYGAFLSPLGHIAARLHAIGNQMRPQVEPGPYRPFVLICGHAGMKTGEDGPTHADPQALQLLQENFVPGTAITLTPWEPGEVWPLVAAAFRSRPALIAPFVTRPKEPVPDRAALGLPPAEAAAEGVYRLLDPEDPAAPALVLQGSDVAYAFVQEALPRLRDEGLGLVVLLVTSAELFDRLPAERRRAIYPESLALRAMGITGFTLPTMYRWIRSDRGRAHTLHPFVKGHYLGSGAGEKVIAEAGLDGDGQYRAIREFLDALANGD